MLVCALLGVAGIVAGDEAPTPEALEAAVSSELPDPECLKAIRRARIAIRSGGSNTFDEAVELCEGRFEVIHEALALARIRDDAKAEDDLLESLVRRFESNAEPVPLAAVERAILDFSLEVA